MIRTLVEGVFGAAVILVVAALLLAAWPIHVQAAGCQSMVASHYGAESGSRTANGERFTGKGMTAAHKTLPFGTRLRVAYGGKSVVVRINDRGPFVRGRDIDLSTAVAEKLGIVSIGVARICTQQLE